MRNEEINRNQESLKVFNLFLSDQLYQLTLILSLALDPFPVKDQLGKFPVKNLCMIALSHSQTFSPGKPLLSHLYTQKLVHPPIPMAIKSQPPLTKIMSA